MTHSENSETQADDQPVAINPSALLANYFDSLEESLYEVLAEARIALRALLLSVTDEKKIILLNQLVRSDSESEAVMQVKTVLERDLQRLKETANKEVVKNTGILGTKNFLEPEEIIFVLESCGWDRFEFRRCISSAARLANVQSLEELEDLLDMTHRDMLSVVASHDDEPINDSRTKLESWAIRVAREKSKKS